jgi:hypothetical protein
MTTSASPSPIVIEAAEKPTNPLVIAMVKRHARSKPHRDKRDKRHAKRSIERQDAQEEHESLTGV